MKRLAVILPPIELFDPYYGGAISRVVENQFSEKIFDGIFIKVFGRCKRGRSRVRTSPPFLYFQILYKLNFLLRKIRLNHWCWCVGIAPFIRNYDYILIENRPQFAIIFRKLFPNKKIYLRFHSDFSHTGEQAIKMFCEASDMVIYCSEAIKLLVENKYAQAKNNACVVYNGSNPEVFFPCEVKKENQILFVGRIAPISYYFLDATIARPNNHGATEHRLRSDQPKSLMAK